MRADELFDHPLVVPDDTHLRLSTDRLKEAHPAVRRLYPKTIDDVKRWIGVPDTIGAKRSCGCSLPAGIPGLESGSELRKQDDRVLRSAYALADEYVHGDSRRVAAYKPILDMLVERSWINIFALRQDIDIYKGAVFEVGSDIKVLWAAHIRIWKGGLLKVTGNAKIDCLSITGNYTGLIKVVDTAVFGRLLSKED
jgi:hypothetical protein